MNYGRGTSFIVGMIHGIGAETPTQVIILSGLAVSGGEDFSPGRLFQKPLERGIAGPVEIRRDACPVEVHVRGQGSGSRVIGQATLLLADLGQGHTVSPKFARHRHQQVT